MVSFESITASRIMEDLLKRVAPLPSQAAYAQSLASIFSMHIHRNELIDDGFSPDELPAPSAVVVAPTGQGKTFLIRKMAECLNLNVITVDCSTLTPEGWKGSALSQRLSAAKSSAKSERIFLRSILFLDEVDKLAKDTHPVNAMTNLLQLFNNGCVSSDNGKTTETIDVSRFTILLGGAFVGLEDIIRERVCPKPKIGFNYDTPNEKLTKAELMQLATPADLTRFGIMPELMGRIGTVLTIAPLGVEDYRQLLNAESGSLRRKYHNYLLNLHGVSFEIADSGVEMLARACMKSQTGARAATPLVNDLMRGAIVAVENELSISKVVLDADADGCCIRYEHGLRKYAFHDPQRAFPNELPAHTVKANTTDSLTRKLCRYYRNARGDLSVLPTLEAYLRCTLVYMLNHLRPAEYTFDSLEKLARNTHRHNEKSPYDIIMSDARLHISPTYRNFDKLYTSWTQQNLIAALQIIMNYIQGRHGTCRMWFQVPKRKLSPHQRRKFVA